MVGDVDAGKSTILGRLLLDLGHVTPAKLADLEATSAKRGVAIEYSFLLDAFQLERDQAITLDLSRIWVRLPGRDLVFVDAPGHRELIRNLLSGASEVDTAVMVVAADDGITPQTRKQALFLRWFGFTEITVAINKLDLARDASEAYESRRAEVETFLNELGVCARNIVPIAARSGDNLLHPGPLTAWWRGKTLLQALTSLESRVRNPKGPLRFVVQDVYRRDGRRFIAGRLDSGTVHVNERIVFWPLQTSAIVTSIVDWPDSRNSAQAGDCVALELDSRIFVDRGAVASAPGHGPELGRALQTTVIWLGASPACEGDSLRLRLGTREIPVTLQKIEHVIDPETLEPRPAPSVNAGDVAVLALGARESIAADVGLEGSSLGRFVLAREGSIVAGGRIDGIAGRGKGEGATNVIAPHSSVGARERFDRNGHRGGVFWLTGLPSSGKSTIAMAVQRMLFERGRHVYVLDGDTLRTGLNIDLGFSDEDRAENVRRTAAVAGVFADAGFVVLTALISPNASDREAARSAYPEAFYEIYISCDLSTAEGRDVKGHYRRARAGEMSNFTGVSAPYDVPAAAQFVVDTMSQGVDESAAALLYFIEARIRV